MFAMPSRTESAFRSQAHCFRSAGQLVIRVSGSVMDCGRTVFTTRTSCRRRKRRRVRWRVPRPIAKRRAGTLTSDPHHHFHPSIHVPFPKRERPQRHPPEKPLLAGGPHPLPPHRCPTSARFWQMWVFPLLSFACPGTWSAISTPGSRTIPPPRSGFRQRAQTPAERLNLQLLPSPALLTRASARHISLLARAYSVQLRPPPIWIGCDAGMRPPFGMRAERLEW